MVFTTRIKDRLEKLAGVYQHLFFDARWVAWSGSCALLATATYVLCKALSFFQASAQPRSLAESFLFGTERHAALQLNTLSLFVATAAVMIFLFPRSMPRLLLGWSCAALLGAVSILYWE